MTTEHLRAWAEIDLDCLRHNASELQKIKSKSCDIMAVVKADAYGHGVAMVCAELCQAGVSRFAVSSIEEAVQLRRAGFDVPLQILSATLPQRCFEVIDYHLVQTIGRQEDAEALSAAATTSRTRARIHIKVDTGMGRLGFPWREATEQTLRIARHPGLIIEGVMTHFASADEEDESFTLSQLERFLDVCEQLKRSGLEIPYRHAANSAAILRYPQAHLDLVRPGILLYGYSPAPKVTPAGVQLRPVMSLKARAIDIRAVAAGQAVGYGRTYRSDGPRRVAVLPIGYADGVPRALSNRCRLMAGGIPVPQIGTICMDHLMADVTELGDGIQAGDEMELFGRQGIAADELAHTAGTISYEILCKIGIRVPRVYIKNGSLFRIEQYIQKIP